MGLRGIISMIRDFRFGMRLCARFPGSSVMAVFVLSMGVALASMMYTMASKIVDQGSGAELDERLLMVEWEVGQSYAKLMNTHDFKHFRNEVESMDFFVGIQNSSSWVSLPIQEEEGKQYPGILTSPSFFDLIDIKPVRGGLFSDESTLPSQEREVIISDSVWLTFFDRSDSAIGELLIVGGMNCKVIGVMPSEFNFPGNRHFWIATDWREYDGRPRIEAPTLGLVGRLKDGLAVEQARAELETIASSLEIQYPDTNKDYSKVRITPYRDMFIDDDSMVMVIMVLFGSFPVLLLACVNVFNIIMARTANRTHELAVRTSMGAKRGQVVWQVMVDGLTLAILGAGLGIGFAALGLHFVSEALASFDFPGLIGLSLSPKVIVFAVCVSLLAGIASSFIPAWRASGINSFAIMKDESSNSTSIYIGWLSKVAVVSQVAFSGVLLFVSIVFLMPSLFLDTIEMPFDDESVLTARVELWTDPQINSPEKIDQFYTTWKQDVTANPGVEAVAMTTAVFGLIGSVHMFDFEGEDQDDLLSSDFSQVSSVTPDFLEVFGADVISGRMINIFDTEESTPVCVVNTNFVNTHCQHIDPIGMRIKVDPQQEDSKWMTIVGIIPSLKPSELGNGEDVDRSFSEILVPYVQRPGWNATMLLRASNAGSPPYRRAMRESMERTAPLVELDSPLTIAERLDVLGKIFSTMSLGAKIFGGSILGMSLIGLYAIVTFATAQRRREFGIRIAIGSTGFGIAKSVLKPWAITIGTGLGLSIIATLILITVYFAFAVPDGQSDGADWKGFGIPALITVSIICVASTIAMAVPAWRATKIDPMAVMRVE